MKANSTSSVCLVGHHVVVTESSIDRGRRDAMRYPAPSTYPKYSRRIRSVRTVTSYLRIYYIDTVRQQMPGIQ